METITYQPNAITKRSSFESFFMEALDAMYWTEKYLVKKLGDLRKQAYSEVVKYAIMKQREQAAEHVLRLEKTFMLLGKQAGSKKNLAVEYITEEIEANIEKTGNDALSKDTALISGAQKLEHYEIASYSCLVQFSHLLGCDEVESLLRQTLREQKENDWLLDNLAGAYAGNLDIQQLN